MPDRKLVEASIRSFTDLLVEKLEIPSYQRPYVWTTNHIDKLIQDWKEFLESSQDNNENRDYFMGSLLLHEKKENPIFEIIDGQQRLTTLFIILLAIGQGDKIPNNFSILPISKSKIRKNYDYVNSKINEIKSIAEKVIDKIVFNVITTQNQDDAFSFFDAQNSRGVKPSETVLVKAFHLRATGMTPSQQIIHAKKWEYYESSVIYGENFLESIITKILWRARNWKGQNKHKFEYEKIEIGAISNIENEFNTRTRKNNTIDYTLDIRIPLNQGNHVFDYIHHYSEIIKSECFEKTGCLYSLIEQVYTPSSKHMLNFFLIGIVVYISKFGKYQLDDFSYRLTRLIAIQRLLNYSIYKETLESSYLREKNSQNLFDMILLSHDSEEVFSEIINFENTILFDRKYDSFETLLKFASSPDEKPEKYGNKRPEFAQALCKFYKENIKL